MDLTFEESRFLSVTLNKLAHFMGKVKSEYESEPVSRKNILKIVSIDKQIQTAKKISGLAKNHTETKRHEMILGDKDV